MTRSSPSRKREVQRRARRIMNEHGWGYGKAMQRAGWIVARAARDGARKRPQNGRGRCTEA
jgi:hypothetical protein